MHQGQNIYEWEDSILLYLPLAIFVNVAHRRTAMVDPFEWWFLWQSHRKYFHSNKCSHKSYWVLLASLNPTPNKWRLTCRICTNFYILVQNSRLSRMEQFRGHRWICRGWFSWKQYFKGVQGAEFSDSLGTSEQSYSRGSVVCGSMPILSISIGVLFATKVSDTFPGMVISFYFPFTHSCPVCICTHYTNDVSSWRREIILVCISVGRCLIRCCIVVCLASSDCFAGMHSSSFIGLWNIHKV